MCSEVRGKAFLYPVNEKTILDYYQAIHSDNQAIKHSEVMGQEMETAKWTRMKMCILPNRQSSRLLMVSELWGTQKGHRYSVKNITQKTAISQLSPWQCVVTYWIQPTGYLGYRSSLNGTTLADDEPEYLLSVVYIRHSGFAINDFPVLSSGKTFNSLFFSHTLV